MAKLFSENGLTNDRSYIFGFMSMADDEDLPDGAWMQSLQDSVELFNEMHKTKHNPYEMTMEYINRSLNEVKSLSITL